MVPVPETTDQAQDRPTPASFEQGAEAWPVSWATLLGGCVPSVGGLASIVSHVAQQSTRPLTSTPPADWLGTSTHASDRLTVVVLRGVTAKVPRAGPPSETPTEPEQKTRPSS